MFSNLPPVTKALLIANGVAFVLQLMLGNPTFYPFMLWPLGEGGIDPYASIQTFMPWQLVSYGFLHGGFAHLAFNMLALVMFGAPLEYTWGNRRFATYYFTCVIGAGLCQLAVGSWSVANGGAVVPTIGASGGVFGLLLAYGMLFPNQRVMLLFPPIPMRARTFAVVYAVVELMLGVTNTNSGVANIASRSGASR